MPSKYLFILPFVSPKMPFGDRGIVSTHVIPILRGRSNWCSLYAECYPMKTESSDGRQSGKQTNICMMTSLNGNIFRVTGHVCGEFSGHRWIPQTKTSDSVLWSVDVFFDLRVNKRLSKQSWGWWFETPSHPFWRHCDGKSLPLLHGHFPLNAKLLSTYRNLKLKVWLVFLFCKCHKSSLDITSS